MVIQENINGDVQVLTLQNGHDTAVSISTIGASIVKLLVKDQAGKLRDIVLGYDKVEDYFSNTETYFGATVGRNANRTDRAEVFVEGKKYNLPKNEGEKNLHSGPNGYQIRVWKVEKIDEAENVIVLGLHSPDGDQGFPGNLTFSVRYQLTEENELIIEHHGLSDAPTIFNPTNHSYFNLNGQDSGNIEHHLLTLNAEKFTPIRENSIPTGEIRSVEGTPFDFRQEKEIGQDIEHDEEQLNIAQGYDHNFVITPSFDVPFATVKGEKSRIQLQAFTNLPGVQLYTGNFLEGQAGKGQVHHNRDGFCLETQFFPDATHHQSFPSPVIPANEVTIRKTIYQFSIY